MAKRSSRKSSSGDEALLWGIAAVVVAIVGVGTAIMLTRPVKKKSVPTPTPTPTPTPPVKKKSVPACKVKGGNGKCMSGTNTQGKRNCVGADQLCGVNLAAHTRAHPKAKDENTCEDIFDKYHKNMIKCNDKYKAYVKKDEQGNCLFKCDKAMCCATPTGMNTYYDDNDPTNPPENKCRMSGPGETSCGELDPNCKWTIPAKKQMTKVGCIVGEKPTPPVNKKTAKPTGKCCGSSYVCPTVEKDQCNPQQTGDCYWDDTGECKKENFRMRRRRR